MNRYKTLILAAVISLLGSCAELQGVDSNALSDITFKNWVAKYAPDAVNLVNNDGETEQGIYIKYHHKAPQSHDSMKITNMKWVRYNMNAYNLKSATIVISDSILSHQAGKWNIATHWVPNYRQFDSLNPTFLCPGLVKAMPTLNVGDKVRIYMSPAEGFTSVPYASYGNMGELAIEDYMGYPTFLDLHLVDVNNNAYTQLVDSINNFALHKWKMQATDTIQANINGVVTGLFMKKTVSNPTGDPINKDTIFSMNVTRFFLDDFMLNTTSDSIAREYGRYNPEDTETKYSTIRGNVESMEGNPNLDKIYSIAPLHMRKGETALFLINPYFTPSGYNGNTGVLPAILPYEPNYYKVEIDTVTVANVDDDLVID